MASGSRRAKLTRWFDDYIEEVAVGTPWWVLVGGFGLGMPIAEGLGALVFRVKYQSGTYESPCLSVLLSDLVCA